MAGYSPGIRDKLIGIFILIKVLPLMALAWFAWNEIDHLASTLENQVDTLAETNQGITRQVGELATENSIKALDLKSRESIERLTTDTANILAAFLRDRDRDISFAASLKPDRTVYRNFLNAHITTLINHGPWVMSPDGTQWIPGYKTQATPEPEARNPRNRDNEQAFHYRPPDRYGNSSDTPMYLEMTFVDLTGQELVKYTTVPWMDPRLNNIAVRENTWCKAETYFQDLRKLGPGEIYVSEVIGPYVKTQMIGPYTRKRAQDMGIDFKPEESGYAGKENPVGKRFQGLIRWASPVVENSRITGYVTLALDHTHIMEFTDHVVPTAERYSDISDAGSGNYAFIWDHQGKNISHPRDYFITGYDPETGKPAVPWLDSQVYEKWVLSALPIWDFLDTIPQFDAQSLDKRPAPELTRQGMVGLDCRYLNFAPQCDGWLNLTENGGSGSFVIFWSGLLKLTTAASIPYYTGQYGLHPRGFGFVTIGANVEEFHKAAVTTADEIKVIETSYLSSLSLHKEANKSLMSATLRNTSSRLALYTLIMIAAVIGIAVIMASTLTTRITTMIQGIRRFQKGEIAHRLTVATTDEMGELGKAFNLMADDIQRSLTELNTSKEELENSNQALQTEIQERIGIQEQLQLHQNHLEDLVSLRTRELENKIREHQATEAALRKSEEKFVKLYMLSPVWICLTRMADGKFINVNQAFIDITGFSRQEAVGYTINALNMWLEPAARSRAIALLRSQGKLSLHEERFRMKNNEIRDFLWSASMVEIDGEDCVLNVLQDITQLRRNEREMSTLRTMLHNIIHSLPSMIIGIDNNNRITLWNTEAEKQTGIGQYQAMGKSVYNVIPILSGYETLISEAIEKAQIRQIQRHEAIIRDVKEFFDMIICPLDSRPATGAVIRLDRITDRVLMEQQMIQSEKMQSIGSLAAGMAHEINNPLAGIMQTAQVIRNRIQEGLPANAKAAQDCGITMQGLKSYMEHREIFRMIDAIMASGKRAADIVDNMLSFSRKSDSIFGVHDISALLDKTIDIIRNDYDLKKRFDFRNITIIKEYETTGLEAFCDPGKIQQVFFNILKNGAQAMIDYHKGPDQSNFILRIYPEPDRVCVSIQDNGPGMPPEIKGRIFEPFFTTKPVGVGTGLGLYVSYFIVVEDHKGAIAVESAPGNGTTFTIKLPIHYA
ncbi:MAG: ATP-binding protein [Pseudomonadota bacterium]